LPDSPDSSRFPVSAFVIESVSLILCVLVINAVFVVSDETVASAVLAGSKACAVKVVVLPVSVVSVLEVEVARVVEIVRT
jgi:hypothetical protein